MNVSRSFGAMAIAPLFLHPARDATLGSKTNNTKQLSHLGEMRPINKWSHPLRDAKMKVVD